IENRIYHQIEELEQWDLVISTIHKGLKPHIKHLLREVTDEDVLKLTEIKIKRITKFDLNKAEEELLSLEGKIKEVKYNLANLIDYAINYFKELKTKYGKGKERKTEIKTFENIVATKVVVANKKLYVNKEEGFVGTSMRKDEYVCDCSDIDDIIAFKKDGTFMVSKVDSKVFMGKNIIHCAVFKKKDNRTVYNMIYKDGGKGVNYIKRFSVTGVTRNKDYSLCKTEKESKVLYFTSNPNGEAEVVTVHLRALQKLKKLRFDADFSEIVIKGRSSGGNILSKNSIKKVELKSEGVSTLSARKIWFDSTVKRLNVDDRGELLGEFQADDKLLTINQKGEIQVIGAELSTHFDEDMIVLEKLNLKKPISIIYFDGNKQSHFVKRFVTEDIPEGKYSFIGEHKGSILEVVSTDWRPIAEVVFVKQKGKDRKKEKINLEEFISIKGWKSLGNKLSNKKVKEIKWLDSLPYEEVSESNDTIPIKDEHNEPLIIKDVEVGEITQTEEKERTDNSSENPNVSDEGAQQITLDL
ncbi:MAG: DNA gyrase/topoisomerase IV subunit A, partial [Flavobacteriales bacterium]|nr:DNA gyrase/topoisomerase IV subunit A [Flavobacteriales bacterium]